MTANLGLGIYTLVAGPNDPGALVKFRRTREAGESLRHERNARGRRTQFQ